MGKGILATVLFIWAVFGMLSFNAEGLVNKGEEETSQNLTVLNSQGERLGTVGAAAVDQFGNIILVIVSIEDEKGEQNKKVFVPISAFSKGSNGNVILDIDRQMLADAPEIDSGRLNDPAFLEKIFRYYGQAPPWGEGRK